MAISSVSLSVPAMTLTVATSLRSARPASAKAESRATLWCGMSEAFQGREPGSLDTIRHQSVNAYPPEPSP